MFAATSFSGNKNVGAVFEWIIALVFAFYVFTFFVDLVPAGREAQVSTNMEDMRMREAENGVQMMDGNGYGDGVGGRHTSTANL